MKKKMLVILVCIAAASFPVGHARAAMPMMIGATVAGKGVATTPGGILATTMDVAAAAEYTVMCIDAAIVEAAGQIVQALQGQTEAMKIMSQGMFEAQLEAMKQMSMANLKTDLERKVDTNAQAENSCHARDGAAAYGVGRKAEGGFRKELNRKSGEVADGKLQADVDVLLTNYERMRSLEGEDPAGDWMFPPNGLIPDENLKKAHEIIRQNLNPRPTPKISASLESSAAGKEALYLQQVKLSRLAVADDTLNAIVAAHSPLVDAGAVLEALQQSMGEDAVDVPRNAAGRTSVMSYLDVWSRSRFGNPNWHQRLFQATDEIKLAREMAYMQAMQVELDRRNLEFQMRNAHLLSSILGILVEQTHNPLVHSALDPARSSGRRE